MEANASLRAVQACFERIERSDGVLRSFVCTRRDAALEEARARDSEPPRGPLHGIPFAVKDVFATADLPTEYGSPYYTGFRPARDAAAVALLRQAGAVLVGKVATVEFAGFGAVPETRNPVNAAHSPGGSSAGSGAAVGGGLVPLALGTQTGGSIIRPASFCGAAGMKPTWGRVPCEGVKPLAPSLDTVGWIANGVDLLRAAAAASGVAYAPSGDQRPPRALRVGCYLTPYADQAESDSLAALRACTDLLEGAGHSVEPVVGPDGADQLNDWQSAVMMAEGRISLMAEYRRDPALAHPEVRDMVENARGLSSAELAAAYDGLAALRPLFDQSLAGFDAWLTPAVPGIATRFEQGNGVATFNRLFTALHLPCITLPGFTGAGGMPVGVQLVGPRFADEHLLRVAGVVEKLIRSL